MKILIKSGSIEIRGFTSDVNHQGELNYLKQRTTEKIYCEDISGLHPASKAIALNGNPSVCLAFFLQHNGHQTNLALDYPVDIINVINLILESFYSGNRVNKFEYTFFNHPELKGTFSYKEACLLKLESIALNAKIQKLEENIKKLTEENQYLNYKLNKKILVKEVIIVRNAEAPWQYKALLQGACDFGLNEAGLKQAQDAACLVKKLVNPIDCSHVKMISSDLLRAIETATEVTKATGIPNSERVKELNAMYHGDFHFKFDETTSTLLNFSEVIQQIPVNSETLQSFHHRIIDAMNEILRKSAGTKTLIIVTHDSVFHFLAESLAKCHVFTPHGGVSRFKYTKKVGWQVELLQLNQEKEVEVVFKYCADRTQLRIDSNIIIQSSVETSPIHTISNDKYGVNITFKGEEDKNSAIIKLLDTKFEQHDFLKSYPYLLDPVVSYQASIENILLALGPAHFLPSDLKRAGFDTTTVQKIKNNWQQTFFHEKTQYEGNEISIEKFRKSYC